MQIIVNPGTGPVADATEEQAAANIATLADEVAAKYRLIRISEHRAPGLDYGDGRFAFLMTHRDDNGREYTREIQMPGLPLEQVNFGARPNDNPWQFPRLYVDDDSWLWKFALDVCGPQSPPINHP